MVMMPGIGWTNAVPDATAQVEFDVNGTTVKFTGMGYHDRKIPDPIRLLFSCH